MLFSWALQLALAADGTTDRLHAAIAAIDTLETSDLHAIAALVDEGLTLAWSAVSSGELDQALDSASLSNQLCAEALGERAPECLAALMSVGDIHRSRGELEQAREALQEVATGFESLPEHVGSHSQALARLTLVSLAEKDLVGATLTARRALELAEQAYGANSIEVSRCFSLLSQVYMATGEAAEARQAAERAIEIAEPLLPSNSLDLLGYRHNAAVAAMRSGEPAWAAEQMRAVLAGYALVEVPAIRRVRALADFAAIHHALGDLDAAYSDTLEAIRVLDEEFGSGHPDLAFVLRSAMMLASMRGDESAARLHSERLLPLSAAMLDTLDAVPRRVAEDTARYSQEVLRQWLELHRGPGFAREAWAHVLRHKGAATRRWDRTPTDDAEAALIDQIRELEAAQIRISLDPHTTDHREQVLAVVIEKEHLERTLAASRARGRRAEAPATPASICDQLGDDAALVDLFRLEATTAAFVVRGGTCRIVRVDLAGAPLDDAVEAWQAALASPEVAESLVRLRGTQVRELVWDPLVEALGEAETIWFVPDGPLNTAPLGVLPTRGGRYLVEERTIVTLDRSTRLTSRLRSQPHSGAILVGDVDYGPLSRNTGQTRLAGCGVGQLLPLSGTGEEVENIARHWRRPDGPLRRLEGEAATEAEVMKAAEQSGLVHLGTHGFSAATDCQVELDVEADWIDPMIGQGLALAHANAAAGPAGDDGLVTARELGARDLSGTQLVVLSACSTGLGYWGWGEGVKGLPRALAQSGARAWITSLWPVPDTDTSELMTDFYRHYLRRNRSPAAALRAAQRAALARQRRTGTVSPRAWGAFVVSGPGALTPRETR